MTETTRSAPGRSDAKRSARKPTGLAIERVFTSGVHPYAEVTWERRDVVQTNWKTGEVVFEQRGVEFPDFWSVNASTIVTTKYFRGALGTPAREQSLRQLIDRVVKTYRKAGEDYGYFATPDDAEIFEHELTWMLLHQYFSFNSPVWFNVGTASPAQVSACFILSVDDSMDSILNWYREEGFIFKGGSGAGINLSRIRSSKELLSSGGTASGPVSFMRGADASAGTIKSGGATRRAAKMVVLDVDHPDIEEFIETKAREEHKIRALRDAGFDMDLGGKDITSVQYQNANNSVRVTDEFMRAVENGREFGLRARTDGRVLETVDAKALFGKIAQAAWECADPGIQYDDTINDWHTNPETGRITASNPCFTGDTLVAIADSRRFVRIDELVGTETDVYSKAGNGQTVVRTMKNIRLTRAHTPIVEVTLDDFTSVRCTPDHLFMLRDGRYLAASELTPGTSLERYDSVVGVGRELLPSNHKVRSVTAAGLADVYDGEVEATHNFAVVTSGEAGDPGDRFSGIFVHNCSEYMSLDNSSCNLASLNLLKFLRDDDSFDADKFEKAVELIITAMDISICFADFPTVAIGETTRDYRQLGIGYANLGALLMATGHGYDSEGGRALAAAITSLMTGTSYRRSAELAGIVGPYAGYARNADAHKRVMRKHKAANDALRTVGDLDASVHKRATKAWDAVVKIGEANGYRNAQASVLAPTGCLTADTLVSTDRGLTRLGELGDVWGERWQDLDAQVSTDEGPRQATRFFVNGEEPTRLITTEGGYTIQGTLAHRIKVVEPETGSWVWKRMADVQTDDLVPIQLGTLVGEPRLVPLPVLEEAYYTGDQGVAAPDAVTPELAELVGYFMGAGSLLASGIRVRVPDADLDVVDRLRVLAKDLFHLEPTVTPTDDHQDVLLTSVRLARWWQAAGFSKARRGVDHTGRRWSPRIPSAILETNDGEVYAGFLRGLFEADGMVVDGVPSVTTASRAFAAELRTLLLTVGLATTTREIVGGFGGQLFQVRLRNIDHALRFDERVGFLGRRKNELVVELDSAQAGNRDRIALPRPVWEAVLAKAPEYRRKVLPSLRRLRSVPRQTAEQLFQISRDPRLAYALGYLFERVASNADGGVQPTYDISVPDNVTYVASGFVSHNTIGFMMDCDTTGIEPDFSLVKFKKLVGGGSMQIVNQTIPRALRKLGYTEETSEAIIEFIAEHGHVIDAPGLRPEHYEVFDTAMGQRAIKPMGHVRMMAAAQPFLSGAISKTVNLPESATVEDIADVYLQGWKLGLKALAVYRDNCKVGQPLSDGKSGKGSESAAAGKTEIVERVVYRPTRKRLPKSRPSRTTSFSVGGAEGYMTSGSYPDDGLGELFLKLGKQGSTLSGVMDAFSIAVSIGLQYGVPLETFVQKFTNLKFEPAGLTDDPDIRMAQSIMDYIFRRLALDYLSFDERAELGIYTATERARQVETGSYLPVEVEEVSEAESLKNDAGDDVDTDLASQLDEPVALARPAPASARTTSELFEEITGQSVDAPLCLTCGTKMRPSGSCYVCEGCGSTSGCS